MKTISLNALRERVERKKAAIGWVDDDASTAALRNSGLARTQDKRAMLERIDRRAKAAGRRPVIAKY